MKKTLALLLAVVTLLSLCACGENYSKRRFDYWGDDVHWDMTEEEVQNYLKETQLTESEIEVDRYDTMTTIEDDKNIFRFDHNGKLDMMKSDMGYGSGMLNILQEWYGEYDDYKYASNVDMACYTWYGTLAGQNTEMNFIVFDYGQCYLEFTLAQ